MICAVRKQGIEYICHPDCPYWGQVEKLMAENMLYETECDCGHQSAHCGYCWEAGRIFDCTQCFKDRLRTRVGGAHQTPEGENCP
jgi:hypothetical protein